MAECSSTNRKSKFALSFNTFSSLNLKFESFPIPTRFARENLKKAVMSRRHVIAVSYVTCQSRFHGFSFHNWKISLEIHPQVQRHVNCVTHNDRETHTTVVEVFYREEKRKLYIATRNFTRAFTLDEGLFIGITYCWIICLHFVF